MLVLRLLLMALSIICLMDGHAEVSSSTTGLRNKEESSIVKANMQNVETLDRKKKKKPKKPKKPKNPKKPKKPKLPKPVITTPIVSTSTMKIKASSTTSTTPTTPTITIATTTTTTETTTEATTSTTTTATSSTPTTTSTATTTIITSSVPTTAKKTSTTTTYTSTTTTALPTATTSAPVTTDATTADSGGEDCTATNGKLCIFPFKDGNQEYSECKNHGGKYFWCATSIYESGKYKHWSYCPKDRSCPLEGDGECRATNNKPCVFPFKDGKKEYNECANFGGKYYWCATATNSEGMYTTWSKCPTDGSCPFAEKTTLPMMTSVGTTASTTLPTNEASATDSAIISIQKSFKEINDTLQSLDTVGFSNDEKQLLQVMSDINDHLNTNDLTRIPYDPIKINNWNQKLQSATTKIKATKQISPGFKSAYQETQISCSISAQNARLSRVDARDGKMFLLSTVSYTGKAVYVQDSSLCCLECKSVDQSSELFEFSESEEACYCYKTKQVDTPKTITSSFLDSGICVNMATCGISKDERTVTIRDLIETRPGPGEGAGAGPTCGDIPGVGMLSYPNFNIKNLVYWLPESMMEQSCGECPHRTSLETAQEMAEQCWNAHYPHMKGKMKQCVYFDIPPKHLSEAQQIEWMWERFNMYKDIRENPRFRSILMEQEENTKQHPEKYMQNKLGMLAEFLYKEKKQNLYTSRHLIAFSYLSPCDNCLQDFFRLAAIKKMVVKVGYNRIFVRKNPNEPTKPIKPMHTLTVEELGALKDKYTMWRDMFFTSTEKNHQVKQYNWLTNMHLSFTKLKSQFDDRTWALRDVAKRCLRPPSKLKQYKPYLRKILKYFLF